MMTEKQKIKRKAPAIALVIALVLALTACGKSVFTVSENSEKRMTITADNAKKDAFFVVGTLNADEGE